jgi:hypothetical protein
MHHYFPTGEGLLKRTIKRKKDEGAARGEREKRDDPQS